MVLGESKIWLKIGDLHPSISLTSRIFLSFSGDFTWAIFSGRSSQKDERFAMGTLEALHSTDEDNPV